MQITCRCGNVLTNNSIPNEVELLVYTDFEWDKITTPETLVSWQIPLPKHDVWRCPKCERVYVFEEGNPKATKIYALEENLKE